MALTDSNMGPADIAAVMGNNGFGGFGGWGNGDFWLILILLFAFGGFGGWGGGMNGYGAGAMGGVLYPWMNQLEATQGGFNQQTTNTALNGISDAINAGFAGVSTGLCNGFAGVNQNVSNGFAGVNQNLCGGFAGVNANIANGFAQAEIADNARQIANMQQAFNSQTTVTQGMNTIASSLQNCCCENRQNIADLKYTVATENCADRAASYQNTRDIIDSQTRGTQAILDKLCTLELDNVKSALAQAQRDNTALQNQLNMANLAASQNAQTAQIEAGQRALANEVEQYINPTPIPAYTVVSPHCCQTPYYNYGCGCNA